MCGSIVKRMLGALKDCVFKEHLGKVCNQFCLIWAQRTVKPFEVRFLIFFSFPASAATISEMDKDDVL
jgi:hypothetical protein